MKVPLETREDPKALRTYRNAFADAIRDHHARGEPARSWARQFLIRHCAWPMLDHAWQQAWGHRPRRTATKLMANATHTAMLPAIYRPASKKPLDRIK